MAGSNTEITVADRIRPALSGEKHDTRWKKGQSGNPNGRPPGSVSIVEGIKQKLLEIEPGNKKTYLELFLTKLFLKAIKEGNEQLMKDMINRVDGMPKQFTDLTTNGKELKPILVKFLDEDNKHTEGV